MTHSEVEEEGISLKYYSSWMIAQEEMNSTKCQETKTRELCEVTLIVLQQKYVDC